MNNIRIPTFVVDKQVCLANIQRMSEKAKQHGLRFRPHFKTHQSACVGEWFRSFGVTAITVSSVSMAGYFAGHGWKDITIAFPVNCLETDEINRLASLIDLQLLVDNEASLAFLEKHLASGVGVFIEADTGHHRSGVDVIKTAKIDILLELLKKSRWMKFRGFLSHTGQTYSARSREDILNIHAGALMKMRSLKNHYKTEWPGLEISLGDTPACSVSGQWDEVDEIRPGNFVFYDLMQYRLGVCNPGDIAARVVCPVVSRSVMRNEMVIYGGAIHLSKEFLIGQNGRKSYGSVLFPGSPSGTEEISVDAWIAGLSQEHGIIRGPFEKIRDASPGDLVEIIPVHSCLTADLAGYYVTRDGEVLSKMNRKSFPD